MIIFGIVVRGTTILGEYGISHEELSNVILSIISRNTSAETRFVPMQNGQTCAVLNKMINGEMISFACVIDTSQDRDVGFNFLDSLANFFDEEAGNPRMRSEMNSFISRHMKSLMVTEIDCKERANTQTTVSTDRMSQMNESLARTTEIAKGNIEKMMENDVRMRDLEIASRDLKETVIIE